MAIMGMAFTSMYTPVPEEEEGIFIELDDFIPEPIQATDLENMTDDERRNIAVNQTMKHTQETDPYDYSDVEQADDAYKEELVKNALSEDEYKKIFERDDLNINYEEEIEKPQEIEEKHDKPSNFQGSTYISYFLKDRYKMKIPVPTYKCESLGKVIINITVNRDGKVSSYEIDATSTSNECLRTAAIQSVKKSRFNQNYDAPLKQKGTITYIFEAQ
jgi:TonB family protein